MKFVFCLLPEQGHINPFIGLAQALQDLKHDICIVAAGDFSAQTKKSQLPFSKDLIPSHPSSPLKGRELNALIASVSPEVLFDEAFIKPTPKLVGPHKDFLSREKPDAVIIDPMNYPAIIAAQSLGLKWFGVSTSLTSVLPDNLTSEVRKAVESLAAKRAEVFRQFGEVPRFRAADALSPYLNISFSTREFIGPIPEDVKAVGPSRPLRQRGDEKSFRPLTTDKPIVYVSFGSQAYYQPEIFKKIILAGQQLSIHLVISVGDLVHESGWQSTEYCDLYEYAPQLEILRQASLFVTHGGANSVAEGLTAGVPMLIHPICNDQIHQAYFVEKSGVGRVTNLNSASVEEIVSTFGEILSDQSMRTRLRSLSQSYQVNGALEAATWITRADYHG